MDTTVSPNLDGQNRIARSLNSHSIEEAVAAENELLQFYSKHKMPLGKISDGYHTFDELYAHRCTLFIALCKAIYIYDADKGLASSIWRSRLHSDGTFLHGWFVLGIGRAAGHQITYHLPESMWELTEFAFTEVIAPEFDGHTSQDSLDRLLKYFVQ